MTELIGKGFGFLKSRVLWAGCATLLLIGGIGHAAPTGGTPEGAANVTAKLVGHTLIISGDDMANQIDVYGAGTAGNVKVSVLGVGQTLRVNNGTTLGAADGKFTGVRNILLNGGAGDDDLHVFDIHIAGNVTVIGGSGNDLVAVESLGFNTYIGGRVVLDGGSGDNDQIVVVNDGSHGLTIGGGVEMTNHGTRPNVGCGPVAAPAELFSPQGSFGGLLLTTNGSGNIAIGGSVVMNDQSPLDGFGGAEITTTGSGNIGIRGAVIMNGGDGRDVLKIEIGTITPPAASTPAGPSCAAPINYYSESGSDRTIPEPGDPPGMIDIAGNVFMNGGNGHDQLLVSAGGNSVAIHGSLILNGGLGDDGLDVFSFNGSGGIGLARTGRLGDDRLEILSFNSISIHGSLILNGGLGDDSLEVLSFNLISIHQSLLLDGGAGNDFMRLQGITVDRNATVFAGDGNDRVDLGFNTVGDNAKIFGESGNDTIIAGSNTVGGNVGIFGGIGDDSLFLDPNEVGGNANIFGEAGNDTICAYPDTVDGNVGIFGGIGDDSLFLDPNAVTEWVGVFGIEHRLADCHFGEPP